MPDVNPTSAICHFTFYLSSLILPVQSHLVSFGINEESHVSYFGRNLGFWHHHFTTRFFDTVNNRLDVWVCIQINNSTIHRWFVHLTLSQAARGFSITHIGRETGHFHPHHFRHIRHFNVEDGFIEFFGSYDIRSRNLEPVE